MAWSLVKSKKHLKKWNQCSHTLSMQGARVAKKGKVGQGPRQAAKAWVCTFGLHQRSCLLDKRLWKEVYHPTSRKMIMHLQFSREKGLGDIHQAADSSPAPLRDHRWEDSQSVNGRGMTLLLIVSRTCHHKKRRIFWTLLSPTSGTTCWGRSQKDQPTTCMLVTLKGHNEKRKQNPELNDEAKTKNWPTKGGCSQQI